MITVVMYRGNNRFTGFSARGHANYAEYGTDIVCSAVSALLQAAVIGLDVAGVEAKISGRMRVRIPPRLGPEGKKKSELLLETLHRSLRAIEAGYPENLKVIIIRKPKGGYIRV